MVPTDLGVLPFGRRPFRWRMGTRSLDVDEEWILVDDRRDDELALRRALLRQRPDAVVGSVDDPRVLAASRELDEAVVGWLVARGIDVPESPPEVPVIARAGLRTQEDWCLLVDLGRGPVLAAAMVCFPTVWRLPEKLGLGVTAIHAPVPGYDDSLGPPVEALLDRMSVDDARWRLNWNLTTSDDLHLPVTPPPPDWGHVDVGTSVWLRVERQTLRRLPDTGALAFSIRVLQQRLDSLLAHPDVLDALGAAVDSLPPEVRRYKGLEDLSPRVREWISATQKSRGSSESIPRSSS